MILIKKIDSKNAEVVCNKLSHHAVLLRAKDDSLCDNGEMGMVCLDELKGTYFYQMQGGMKWGEAITLLQLIQQTQMFFEFYYIEIIDK
jgi:hypothetical protein